ncbi:MAG: dUTP diphosphatase [Deltaproteobacteria bacterium]|jgi:dUTP pyrophosphatase|nr:dUTP diphosphatase [Deltaproteobacteria bacterium]
MTADHSAPVVRFKRTVDDPDWPLPSWGSAKASGLDLAAAVTEPVTIAPGAIVLIPSGWSAAIPDGWEGQVRPRSGLALRHGLTVINAPGTIDSDYRGEIGLAMVNLGAQPVTVKRGDRLAQLVIARVERPELVQGELDVTDRGEGGFGSTGR